MGELSYTSCHLHATCISLAEGSQQVIHSRTGDGVALKWIGGEESCFKWEWNNEIEVKIIYVSNSGFKIKILSFIVQKRVTMNLLL